MGDEIKGELKYGYELKQRYDLPIGHAVDYDKLGELANNGFSFTKEAVEHISECVEENPVVAGVIGTVAFSIYGLYKLITYNPNPVKNEW